MIDWSALFGFSVNPIEIVLRGTAMYWFIFLLFRILLRRDIGAIAIADVMLLVLIADASSNGMSGEYTSITDGCLLVATIAGWNYVFDWLSFHSVAIRRLVQPPPLLLVKDGKLQRKNMRQELITSEEIRSRLREQGITDLNEVKIAYLEEDGEISVMRQDGKEPEQSPGGSKSKTF
ncbi:MAG TPA: YetF domain-containing protein [Nitrosospira sp.]|nr:YetF domain-containing protein [Nitrosospira sp.]